MTDQLTVADVRTGSSYEGARAEVRERLASIQSNRRVRLGEEIALVFESRDTMRASLEEYIRVERRADPTSLAEAAAVFSALLPPAGSLIGTVHLDIEDAATLADRSVQLEQLPASLWLDIAGRRVGAQTGPDEDMRAGAAFLVFALDPTHRSDWLTGGPVTAVVEHPMLQASTPLTAPQITAIGTDLGQ